MIGKLVVGVIVAFSLSADNVAAKRIDLNFKPSGVGGRKIPAISVSALLVSTGKLTVQFDRQETLETLTVTPPGSGPFPLAVLSHGTPLRSGKKARQRVRIRSMFAVAEDFARRGYKAVVFARRGYASSSGRYRERYGRCSDANESSYTKAASEGAKDYKAVIETLANNLDIDGTTVIAAGVSGGGFAASALAMDPPAGLIGIINFAGGRGGAKKGGNCSESGFVGAFRRFGESATVPALWLYSTTDRLFWPVLVDHALDAYAQNGAPVRLDRVGPLWFTGNGHRIAYLGGRELWRPRIDDFLDAIGAPNWERAPDDAAVAKLPAPPGIGQRGERRWRLYLGLTGHKAFAHGGGRMFGWTALQDTVDDAKTAAMHDCEKRGAGCRLISVNGKMVE